MVRKISQNWFCMENVQNILEDTCMKIDALVVTYNRKLLLQECLEAILHQTYPVTQIVVIDNASTDGTNEYFSTGQFSKNERIRYIRLDKNEGGSGGFYEGIKRSYQDCDYIWLMDDDTIPEKGALAGLVNSAIELETQGIQMGFLASTVFGMDHEPMNVPELDNRITKNGYSDWYCELGQNMVKIRCATFVSLLIPTSAVKKVGLPVRWYFLWGDDYEYTQRLTTYYGPAYLTGKSKVVHKRKNARALTIKDETDPDRIRNYYYFYRNNLLNTLAYKTKKEYYMTIAQFYRLAFSMLKHKNVSEGKLKYETIMKATNDVVYKRYDAASFADRVSSLE